MRISDYFLVVGALSSCAIEGNQFAIEMLELRESDPEKFLAKLIESGLLGKEGDN